MASQFDELRLETDEEVTSAIDKIKKSKRDLIALVLPRGAVLGQSIVNLKLIFKQANDMDKTVAIISPDRVARNLADRVGFLVGEQANDVDWPVVEVKKADQITPEADSEPAPIAKKRFDTHKDEIPAEKAEVAQTEEDSNGDEEPEEEELNDIPDDAQTPLERVAEALPPPVRKMGSMIPSSGSLRMYRNQKKRPMLIASAILVGFGVIILAVAAVVVPSATVILTVEAQPFSDSITSTVSLEAQSVDIDKGIVLGKLQTQTIETKVSAKASGKKDQGEKATGTVSLFNYWDSASHTYPAGTTFTAKNGNRFVTQAEVTVGGATSTISGGQSVITPGKKDVDVVAFEPGEAYNIGATSFVIPTLPKAQQDKIYATSSTKFTGGTSKLVGVVTADDITKLTDTAKTQNKSEAVAKFKTDLTDQVVLEQAVQTQSQEVVTSVVADAVAESVEVTVIGKFGLITFKEDDQKTLVQKLVSVKIPQDQTLVTSGDGIEVDTSQFEVNLVTDAKIELNNKIKAFTVNGFDQNQIRRLLVNAKPNSDSVVAITKAKIPTQKAEVTRSPKWWPRLPLWSEKIKLDLRYTSKEE